MENDRQPLSAAPPETNIPPADSLFDRIALTISGGGFRAAAYGLGTLNALHLLGILENVHMLSTISGGTITGAFYALRRKQGQSFAGIYTDFYERLGKDDVLEKALGNWERAARTDAPNYKLIRAFADSYNELLYDNAHFGEFWKPDDANRPFHLQSVIFSATELYSGIAFRFQHASHLPDQLTDGGQTFDSYQIGNGNVTIPRDRAKEIRLADIVASSSCFPVGFEPLVLPDDFFPPTASNLSFSSMGGVALPVQRVGVIDGGVYDNQGIEAIVTANNRNSRFLTLNEVAGETKKPDNQLTDPASGSSSNPVRAGAHPSLEPSTLLLVADVASAEMGIYEPPGPGPARGRDRSLGQLGRTANTILIVLVAVAVLLSIAQLNAYGGNFFFGLLAGLALGGAALLYGAQKIWGWLTGQFEQAEPAIYRMAMPVFLQFSFGQWGYLLKVRLMTMVKLLLSVFLRRVRSLNYGLVLQSDSAFAPKAVISSILGGIARDAESPRPGSNPGSSQLRQQSLQFLSTIKLGRDMGTTLWWLGDKQRMDAIIASAEITLIYRLLRYWERPKNKPQGPDVVVYNRARLIWDAFLLAQDKQQPATYFPQFRLHPVMAEALDNPAGTTPADLIKLAR